MKNYILRNKNNVNDMNVLNKLNIINNYGLQNNHFKNHINNINNIINNNIEYIFLHINIKYNLDIFFSKLSFKYIS